MTLRSAATPHLPTISAVASVVEELGSEVHVLFGVDAPPVSSDAVRAAEEADEEGGARLIHDEAERSTFTARVSAASQVKVGEPITLTVNCEAMHVFDPATGDSIGASRWRRRQLTAGRQPRAGRPRSRSRP